MASMSMGPISLVGKFGHEEVIGIEHIKDVKIRKDIIFIQRR